MATVEELKARREALVLRRESLTRRVSAGDRQVEYDLTVVNSALAELDSQIAAASGRKPRRVIRIYQRGKGY